MKRILGAVCKLGTCMINACGEPIFPKMRDVLNG